MAVGLELDNTWGPFQIWQFHDSMIRELLKRSEVKMGKDWLIYLYVLKSCDEHWLLLCFSNYASFGADVCHQAQLDRRFGVGVSEVLLLFSLCAVVGDNKMKVLRGCFISSLGTYQPWICHREIWDTVLVVCVLFCSHTMLSYFRVFFVWQYK